HVTPECAAGGALAKVRDGDVIRVDPERGTLQAKVSEAEWNSREAEPADLSAHAYGLGRDLFDVFRANAAGAEQGAVPCGLPLAPAPAETPGADAGHPVHDHFALPSGQEAR